ASTAASTARSASGSSASPGSTIPPPSSSSARRSRQSSPLRVRGTGRASHLTPTPQLGRLSLAQLGALPFWCSASAVPPALAREWALGDVGRAWLTNAVQLGFIVGTLGSALGNLPDVWSPRRLMMVSAVAGAIANAAVALWVDSLGPALVLRFLTGVCM